MDLIFKDGTSVQLVPAINFTIFLILATVCFDGEWVFLHPHPDLSRPLHRPSSLPQLVHTRIQQGEEETR